MLDGENKSEEGASDMASSLRQRPGLACEECRRRKARCDRARPMCGSCAENGTICVVNDKRPQRGPKKGQLQALRTRVAMLERQLVGQLDYLEESPTKTNTTATPIPPSADIVPADRDDDVEARNVAPRLEHSDGHTPEPTDLPDLQDFADLSPNFTNGDPLYAACMDWQAGGGIIASSAGTTTPVNQFEASPFFISDNLCLSSLVRADLDQLYFDRVDPIAPIVHKQRYFSWALRESPPPSLAQACVRSAMHTVAAAVSSQFRSVEDAFYAETRGMLESLDSSPASGCRKYHSRRSLSSGGCWTGTNMQLEQIQAWLLLAQYEFLRKDEHRAMITAGRAFRLVQLARLFDVDSPVVSPPPMDYASREAEDSGRGNDSSSNPQSLHEGFAWIEEKRRVFWLAYCLDRFLSWRNEWPLLLHEETIHTRLPAPEANFQNNQPIRMDFLSDVLDGNGKAGAITPFAECILLATLYGRCMSHRRLSVASALSNGGSEPHEFWTRHESLAAAVEKRRLSIAQHFRSSSGGNRNATLALAPTSNLDIDPMLTFAYTLAESAIIYLSMTTETSMWKTVEHQLTALTYEQRAFQATAEVVRLAKVIPRLGRFKVHPFVPIALSQAAEFLKTHNKSPYLVNTGVEEAEDGLGALLNAAHSLKDVNNLARELLSMLEEESSHTVHHESQFMY